MIDQETMKANEALLRDLAEPAELLTARHLETSKPWYPDDIVPPDYRFAGDFETTGLDIGAKSALFVNLLTEENLPYYTHSLLSALPEDHPLVIWTKRWTAEEGRHAMVMRDWIRATGVLDLQELEDARMLQVSGGDTPVSDTFAEVIAYVSFQELATMVAHRRTGKEIGAQERAQGIANPLGSLVMATVAGDERKHNAFYSDLTKTAFELNPNMMMQAVFSQLRNFKMPGAGIEHFEEHTDNIALADIYTLRHFKELVVVPTLNGWDVENMPGLNETGERSLARIIRHLDIIDKGIARQEARLETAKPQVLLK